MVQDKPVIQLLGISKAFTTEEVRTHALSDVSLSIARGEYIAISGPSGCGKSTLLSIVGLLDTPTSGEYRLNGARCRLVDVVLQKPGLRERRPYGEFVFARQGRRTEQRREHLHGFRTAAALERGAGPGQQCLQC